MQFLKKLPKHFFKMAKKREKTIIIQGTVLPWKQRFSAKLRLKNLQNNVLHVLVKASCPYHVR